MKIVVTVAHEAESLRINNLLINNYKEPLINLEDKDCKWFNEPWKIASKYFKLKKAFPNKSAKNR